MQTANHHKHPKELFILALCGIIIRFSFWGVGSLLVIYLLEHYNFSIGKATHIYGLFTGASAFLPLLGGYIADRWNYHTPLFLGTILTGFGCALIAMDQIALLYIGLILIDFGFGLFIPSIFTILNYTYRNKYHLREAGFAIYYSSFNIGTFLGILSIGYIAHRLNWEIAFYFAAIIQFLGLIPIGIYYKKYHLSYKNLHPKSREKTKIHLQEKLKPFQLDRLVLIIIFGIISILFWAAYNQGWSSMSVYVLNYTKRDFGNFVIPPAWILSLESLFLIGLAPLFAKIYKTLHQQNKDPSPISKSILGLIFLAICFIFVILGSIEIPPNTKFGAISPLFVITAYFMMAISELLFSPISLSMFTILSPKRFAALAIGFWYLCSGFGNYLAGWIAGYLRDFASLTDFFEIFVYVTIIPAVLMIIFKNRLIKLQHMDLIKKAQATELEKISK